MLSVLIVNWNTKDLLLACLDSLVRFPPEERMEVIVVDNASLDGSASAVEEWLKLRATEGIASDAAFNTSTFQHFNTSILEHVYLIASPTNAGYARGNNFAFEQAKGEWLLTLNPDTEVLEGSLQRAIDTLKRRPREGALGARLISPDGTTQRSVRGFPSLLGILGALLRIDKIAPRSVFGSYTLPAFDYDLEQPAPQPMGTFLMLRRRAVEEVLAAESNGIWHPSGVRKAEGTPAPRVAPERDPGLPSSTPPGSLRPFDESFPIFFNEVDLLKRMKDKGWGCVYDPAVRILHHGGESTKQAKPKMIWESHRSLIRYLKKHALRWWNAPLLALVAIAIWIGALVRARRYDVGFRP